MKTKITTSLFAVAFFFICSLASFANINDDKNPTMQAAVFPSVNALVFHALVDNNENSDLYIIIRNERGNKVYEECQPKTAKYRRKYNLSSLADGNYTFEINNGTDTYTKSFRIETKQSRNVVMK
ncbi:MAG: hypothetical protein H7Y04_13295 [Verrucomicrobia bacterium]|nr:hypothetical protein [Cytophagales bacterium]